MTHAPLSKSRRRLAVLGAAIVIVVIAIVIVLKSGTPSDQQIIQRRLDAAVRDFEARDSSVLPKYFAQHANIHFRDSDITLDPDGIVGTVDTVYNQYPKINIRPKGTEISLAPDGKSAEVYFIFQWTVTSSLYPNAPLKSEDMTDEERPARAALHYVKVDDDWKIADVQLEIPEQ